MKIFISSKVEDFKMDKIEIKGGNRLTGEVKDFHLILFNS